MWCLIPLCCMVRGEALCLDGLPAGRLSDGPREASPDALPEGCQCEGVSCADCTGPDIHQLRKDGVFKSAVFYSSTIHDFLYICEECLSHCSAVYDLILTFQASLVMQHTEDMRHAKYATHGVIGHQPQHAANVEPLLAGLAQVLPGQNAGPEAAHRCPGHRQHHCCSLRQCLCRAHSRQGFPAPCGR